MAELYPHDYGPHAPTPSSTASPECPAIVSLMKSGLAKIPGWKRWCEGVDLVPEFVPGGKLLEIGCASGGRLISLRSLGWQHLQGIELAPSAAERARAEGYPVDCDSVENALARYPGEFFDVIISSMVLEHLFDPFAVVPEISRTLKKGGQFLFSTVVCDSLDAHIYRGYFSGFDLPRHMVFFQKRDIFCMMKEYFAGIECFHQNAPVDFVRSSMWRREHHEGTWFDPHRTARRQLARRLRAGVAVGAPRAHVQGVIPLQEEEMKSRKCECPPQVILYGGTGQSKVVRPIIEYYGSRIVAVFDDTDGLPSPFPDVPIHKGYEGFQRWVQGKDRKGIGFCIAIGNPHGRVRVHLHDLLVGEGLQPVTIIHPSAIIYDNATIGAGSQVMGGAFIGAEVVIGRQCIINSMASVDHEDILEDGVEIAPGHLRSCGGGGERLGVRWSNGASGGSGSGRTQLSAPER